MKILGITMEDLRKAATTLREGGLVVYPTETAYGLGANALDQVAVTEMYALRQRPGDQPTHIIVPDIETAKKYAVLGPSAEQLAQSFWPGALTMILKKKETVYNTPSGERDTLAVRVPGNETTLALAKLAEVPITTPSANRRGDGTPYSILDVTHSFGTDIDRVEVILDAGVLPGVEQSTFIDMSGDEPELMREGPISRAEIQKVLGLDRLKGRDG